MTFDHVAAFEPSVMAPTSTVVVWEGESVSLTHLATGGHVTQASYKLTEDAIHFRSGVVANREEVLPLWAVQDVDLIQDLQQRVRKVGDIRLELDPRAGSNFSNLEPVLKSIRDPQKVRQLIMRQSNEIRRYWNQWFQDRAVEQRRAGAVHLETAPGAVRAAAGGDDSGQDHPQDLMAQLTKLGEMRTAGLLSDEEFAAAKAKLLGQ